MERKDRLKEVYEYVRDHYHIHTQAAFSDYLKYNRAYISSAMNGNEKYLTDKLFKKICETYGNVFNLEYLLTGKGQLLMQHEEHPKTADTTPHYDGIDQSSLINSALAAKDQVIAQLELRISEKDVTIRNQQRLIQVLERRISEIEFNQKSHPFPIGVADQPTSDSDV